MDKLTLGQLYYLARFTFQYRYVAITEILRRIPGLEDRRLTNAD
jgi:folate-dependent tRNA-U54 methylase TrmFO/GidA